MASTPDLEPGKYRTEKYVSPTLPEAQEHNASITLAYSVLEAYPNPEELVELYRRQAGVPDAALESRDRDESSLSTTVKWRWYTVELQLLGEAS